MKLCIEKLDLKFVEYLLGHENIKTTEISHITSKGLGLSACYAQADGIDNTMDNMDL
ncbi:MAG: hypothetical protein U9N54_00880 [candidate division Zixibacteria bacterium]|nr:hypothetical protein [candidate division Zixibacteria bacterium]